MKYVRFVPPRRIERRFWSLVSWTEGCWFWAGPIRKTGYGVFGRSSAHRVAYELAVGPIPGGLVIDHLCRVPSCVNPAHMEPVTPDVNVLRGDATMKTAKVVPLACPACGETLREVIDSRPSNEGWRRRRECRNGHRATTYEMVVVMREKAA